MLPRGFTSVEATIDAQAHRLLDRLPNRGISGALVEFLVFGLKQAWACLFGGLLLALIIGSSIYYPSDAWLTRYDALFIAAIAIQIMMLAHLQRTGHKPVVLMGGATTKVGDPTDKAGVRPMLSEEEIAGNMASIKTVFENFFYRV